MGVSRGPYSEGLWRICSRFSRVYFITPLPGEAHFEGPNPQMGVQKWVPNPGKTLVLQTGVNVI